MPDGAQGETLTGARLRRAALERLRFEQAMGLECVKPVALAPTAAGQEPGTGSQGPAATPPPPAQAATSLGPGPVPAAAAAAGVDLLTPAIAAGGRSGDVAARWKDLEARALACKACGLHAGRTNVVFGCGDRGARLLFVGEGPGQDEDLQGVPFVGRAGQLLNKIIAAMGLRREDVYICNVVKCRPPGNRTPETDEAAACWPLLCEQIELVAPRVIVALGAPATKRLLNVSQGIMSIRGNWFGFRGIPVMPTYHPAFVLRQYTERNRRAVWEDMKLVVARLKET